MKLTDVVRKLASDMGLGYEHSSGSNSIYVTHEGRKVRLSDHDLPPWHPQDADADLRFEDYPDSLRLRGAVLRVLRVTGRSAERILRMADAKSRAEEQLSRERAEQRERAEREAAAAGPKIWRTSSGKQTWVRVDTPEERDLLDRHYPHGTYLRVGKVSLLPAKISEVEGILADCPTGTILADTITPIRVITD